MATLDFKDKPLEKLFRNWKWARNNSVQMLDIATKTDILDCTPVSEQFTFQSIRHQFQCLVTTTDAYCRQFTGAADQSFGMLVTGEQSIAKHDIPDAEVAEQLQAQITNLQDLFKSCSLEETVVTLQSLCNHEYLHHGQLLVMFREAGVDVPERFKKAFAL